MKLRMVLEVDVDEEAWAEEYGLEPAEVEADAREQVTAMIGEEADERAKLMGTFQIRHISTQTWPA